ncbi:MAG TPA: PQQ-dependent sugar dehydrogenase [Paraburkholderia sp.]|jgi:glucose/arabinose dehydrogenase|nr:PQQ-dependent sugar dehydrogenase [Paraburkholderia sp.]
MKATLTVLRFAAALSLVGATVAATSVAAAQDAQDDPPSQRVPQTGQDADALRANLKTIKLPPGFRIDLYAVVPDARQIAIDPRNGEVIVGTTGSRVWRVIDRDKRHVADDVSALASSTPMKMPNGVCFAPDGELYVAEQNRVLAFPAAQTAANGKPDVVVQQGTLIPSKFESRGHSARVCRVGPDGKLYIALGQPWNVPPKDAWPELDRNGLGGIVRIDRDGRHREIVAHGVRNSVGLDFNPKDKTLWFTDNQVDMMGDDIPPGELNHVTQAGQHFGFPWYGGGHVRTNEYKDSTPPAGVVFPVVEYAAHAADLGMTFYTGRLFPAHYRGGIFAAEHGSWNRTTPIGARVVFTPLNDDGSVGPTEIFAQGWIAPDGKYTGRPVDVQALPDGSLLVSDDYAGALYRISYGSSK